MKAMEEKILAEGEIYPGNILKVSGFLNHRIDVDFLMEMGQQIARLFENDRVDKILTVEASGIAIAVAAASYLHVPVVFAKKSKTTNISNDVYASSVASYTHNTVNTVMVSKGYLSAGERVLIVDDFLALGNAVNGLIDLINQAGGEVAGVCAAIEKGFQHGGDALRQQGIKVESLAIVDAMDDHGIKFRSQERCL